MKRLLATLLAVLMLASCAFVLVGCSACIDPNLKGKYTYNTAMSEFPDVWNPHTYQTATDATILDYASVGFYTFDYNDSKDGYKVVNEMAAKDPENVTALYADKYGLDPEVDKNRIWKITIRSDIKWEDGTPITAHDFVTSAKLLLNPVANNYRADSLYEGSLSFINAKNYFYQGKDVWSNNSSADYVLEYEASDLVKGDDGVYVTPQGHVVYLNVAGALDYLGGNSLEAYVDAYGSVYFNTENWEALVALLDEEGKVAATDETIALLASVIATDAWGETAEYTPYYYSFDITYPEVSFEDVGIFSLSDTEFVIALEKPLTGFYLNYALTSSWLVNETLYKACESTDANGIYTNSYGTSVATFMSYGPYKLVEFQADKVIKMEKNMQWYGHADDPDLYQTTHIQIDCVEEASTRLEMFLAGQLDAYGLTSEDMATYQTSDNTYFTTGDSTFFIALNPDADFYSNWDAENAGKNKSILTVLEFRQALSFSLDRMAFCLATSPTNNAGFGVYSSLIISDPENGVAYRTTEQAKKVLVKFWGLEDQIGADELYPDMDAAIASITGYNPEMGKEKFDAAYDYAIANGLMKEGDVVEIKIGTPNSTSSFYSKGYDYLVNNYTNAVKGTKLEGKLTFTKDDTLGNAFSDALKANTVDMLFGVGWTGSALDPYGLIEAYTKSNYQYDPSWDTSKTIVDVEIDGVVWQASVLDWTKCLNGTAINLVEKDNPDNTMVYEAGSATEGITIDERLNILAVLEGAVLDTYDMIPIMDDSSAALKGMQIKYYTEEYIFGVGRGGIKYMTYHYDDYDWAVFVNDQGGILNYK